MFGFLKYIFWYFCCFCASAAPQRRTWVTTPTLLAFPNKELNFIDFYSCCNRVSNSSGNNYWSLVSSREISSFANLLLVSCFTKEVPIPFVTASGTRNVAKHLSFCHFAKVCERKYCDKIFPWPSKSYIYRIKSQSLFLLQNLILYSIIQSC